MRPALPGQFVLVIALSTGLITGAVPDWACVSGSGCHAHAKSCCETAAPEPETTSSCCTKAAEAVSVRERVILAASSCGTTNPASPDCCCRAQSPISTANDPKPSPRFDRSPLLCSLPAALMATDSLRLAASQLANGRVTAHSRPLFLLDSCFRC